MAFVEERGGGGEGGGRVGGGRIGEGEGHEGEEDGKLGRGGE